MRKAGDILSVLPFFSEETMKKAKTYNSLFSSWEELLKGCGLSQGVSHSRIAELERSVLLVEADHPGWIQLLQTKQRELLDQARQRFPELSIAGISFRLYREQG